ncbi:retron St85 family RNA-directed DNA polymerase [Foetidibacter luteolus]|uniref:retron St85 family RNA-directed DNA polymerase n=1 Tax=Foetidibacter luteolus TaxID=2608880 RepID=UPI00129A1500|nr:retron St85 family RNA-directed DNA polymerase [Foetidibacter luteolus]
MADNRLTRQQIYDRIRETSRDDFILEEMKRLGFWGRGQDDPSVSELLIKKEVELGKELDKLLAEQRKYDNKQAVLKEMRMKRMAEAKQKRADNKKKREEQRFNKAEAWRQKKETEIFYLGQGVSGGLNHTENNVVLLQQKGLPVFYDEQELASAAGIELKELKFLSFSRSVSTVNHYRKFYLPKKSGGKRLISAPMPRLKKLQYWILHNVLQKVTLHTAVHGFTGKRSIVTNAQQHIAKDVVINADVKDFFPSIHIKRVKGIFKALGYSEKTATILALVCTEPVTEEVMIDGKNYFIQKGERVLPQGAPTSPALTNIICYHLDKRLQGVASKHQYTYTRYADDITFSATGQQLKEEALLWRVKKILKEEGFNIHPDKIRIMHKGTRQEVTGVVVNKKLSLSRQKLRNFRAMLHNLKTKGYADIKTGNKDIAAVILGYLNYIKMIDPVKALQFQQQVNQLFQQPSFHQLLKEQAAARAAVKPVEKSAMPSPESTTPQQGNGNWWNVTE